MANGQTFTLNIKAIADMKDVTSNISNIQNALSKLKLPDNLKDSFKTTFEGLNKELNNYQKLIANGIKTKGDSNALTKSGNNILRFYNDIIQKMKSIDDSTLRKAFEDIGAGQATKQIQELRQQLESLENDLKSKLSNQKFINFDEAKNNLKSFKTELTNLSNDASKAFKTLTNSTFNTFVKNIETGRLDLAAQNLARIKQQVDAIKNDDLTAWYNNLEKGFANLSNNSGIPGLVSQISNLKSQLIDIEANTLSKLVNEFQQGTVSAEQFQTELTKIVTSTNEWGQAQAQTNREIDQVKSRIQYFFGLNNAINLVKRAIRSAFETVKELDAAMTETAVVTDYTVKDMWNQLPEYTKRANELGVMTKDAYESATLYFQQGLNADQAAALSAETLKMARIAGLDAAEATDRMTNALRGFNMELNTASAQRADDVYSELAAISASDVDEISTAMTKVASLAHSANMEFETTAAFLAQIIETTRESAETAGTALKTVVARFSEVKKLVNEDQLKGTDEEGQVIDVNKVSQALRTAGIDLNKYFIGEVGLDDIFMELASKWDSLTSVQQRYIATQAAGSRQQSRFIALMQDYARTQELVGAAYDAQGASARQFEKTQDSLQSKLARLKNAWNEFLMGITNSSVIKGAVDRLTDLLNLVNKLSNAFGEGASGVVKFGIATAGLLTLKKAFADGGLVSKLLGKVGINIGLTKDVKVAGKSFIKDIIAAGKIWIGAVEKGAIIEESSEKSGGILDFFKGLFGKGKKGAAGVAAADTASVAGASGASAAGASGASAAGGLSTLGWVGIALAIAYASAKAQDYFTSGNKEANAAQKQVDQQQEILNKNEDLLKTQQDALDNYNKNQKILKTSTNKEERENAQKEIETIITTLSVTNPNFITTDKAGNKILNEELLTKSIENLTEESLKEQSKLNFLQANSFQRQSDIINKSFIEQLPSMVEKDNKLSEEFGEEWTAAKILGGSISAYTLYGGSSALGYIKDLYEMYTNPDYKGLSLGERFDLKHTKNQQQIKENQLQAEGILYQGASELLGEKISDQDIILSVSKAYAKAISTQDVGERTKDIDQVSNELSDLAKLATSESGKKILDVINGSYEGPLEEGEIDKLYNSLTLTQQNAIKTLLDKSDDEIQSALTEYENKLIKSFKDISKGRKEDIYKTALDNGLTITAEDINKINQLNLEQLGQVSDIISATSNIIDTNSLQELFQSLPDLPSDELNQIYNFSRNFNLDNPIQAFQQLQKAISSVSEESVFGELLSNIEKANEELFTTSNFVQSFLANGGYDNLASSVDDFIKENGKITSKNIEELAENCSELKFLLDQDIISAQGLASAFTLYENGSIAIDNITDSLLAALSAGESFETLIGNVGQWIEDFSEGADLTEGTQHIVEVLEKAGEYITDWQFGNKPLMNIYDHIFGPSAYDTYMREEGGWNKPFEEIEKDLRGQIDKVKGYAENEGLGALQFLAGQEDVGITEIGKNQFSWDLSGYQHASDAISDIAGKLGVTDDVARAFVESWGSHMYDLGQAWDELNFKDSIAAFNEALGDSTAITEQELNVLSTTTGKTKDEILAAIEAIRGEGNVPIIVSWQDENGNPLSDEELVSKFENTIRRSTGQFATSANSVYSSFLKDFLNEDGLINADELISHLVNDFKLSPAQANTIADNMADSVGKNFSKEIEIPVVTELKDESGNPILDTNGNKQIQVTSKKYTITGESIAEVGAAETAAQAAGAQASMAEILAGISTEGLAGNIQSALENAGQVGAEQIQSAIEGISPTVKINFSGILGGIFGGPVAAKGGIVGSYASGSSNNRIKPGLALTGEEDPEIIWNGEKGYAYLAGKHGPEINNLRPGDQVFNAQDTRAILRRSGISSFAKGTIHSYKKPFDPTIDEPIKKNSKGGWQDESKNSNNDSTSKSSKDNKWQNTLDWLYNLMEDIAELERIQNQLSEKHDRYLEDISKTGRDLYNLTNEELNNLLTQRDNYQEALTRRMQEMREQIEDSKVSQYAWWNDEDNTIEIDWDAINEITDKDKYDEVTDLISKLEKIQDQMDEAEEALWDIEGQIIELKNRYLEEFIDFQKRVYDAVVDSYQKQIDALEVLNETISDSDSQILDSLQKEIDLQRQIRDNTEAEENIRDLEARLAYLRRDTSGANDAEIRKLEKELEDTRKDYTDKLIDQALDRLQESSDAAAEQRQKQIDLLTEQLDYWKEIGAFWPEVAKLIEEGINGEGSLIRGSTLEEILKQADNWKAMSEEQKKAWADDLIKEVNQAGAYLITIAEGFDSLSEGIWALIPESSIPKKHYATGGLATTTGPAWLDGTSSEPEYVLNARQTEAFLRLADVLPSIFGNDGNTINNNNGNTHIELTMNVGEIGSDYDVDRLVDRLKDDLYNASVYRNVNAINFLR